jgi:hypothetical protein
MFSLKKSRIHEASQGSLASVPSPGANTGRVMGRVNNPAQGAAVMIMMVVTVNAAAGNTITNLAGVQSATFDPKNNNNPADVQTKVR